MAQSGFSVDITQLARNMANYGNKAEAAVHMYAETGAKKMEAYAKKNAPWENQTGHARQRLHGYTEKRQGKIRVVIAHGVNYGVYLEKANEEKYAILDKTVLEVGEKEIMPGFKRLLGRIK